MLGANCFLHKVCTEHGVVSGFVSFTGYPFTVCVPGVSTNCPRYSAVLRVNDNSALCHFPSVGSARSPSSAVVIHTQMGYRSRQWTTQGNPCRMVPSLVGIRQPVKFNRCLFCEDLSKPL